jgi:UDP:flavonoid glycosyltransferase YjiC (YdhE family)
MAKILYTWELGEDLGHIHRFLALATRLSAHGHEVVLAAKDLSRIESLPSMQNYVALQSPLWLNAVKGLPEPQVCYADILQRCGYLDAKGLLGMVKAWRWLFNIINPQLLIADHAPTALLASRGLGFPRVTYGSGFFSPPRTTPMPSMRPWMNLPAHRIKDSEAAVLQTINQVLAEIGEHPMHALADLFAVEDHFLMTPEELEHYPARGPASYMGPVLSERGGATPEWPKGPGKKIFAYIKTSHPQTKQLFMQLLDSPFNVLAYVPGLSEERCHEMQAPNIHFSSRPVDMHYVTQHAKAILCHAGVGTILHGLLAGLPVLLLPITLEQVLVARNVSRNGMGIFIDPDQGVPDFIAVIREIVKNPLYSKNAQRFARKYAGMKEDEILATVMKRCEELMNNSSNPG